MQPGIFAKTFKRPSLTGVLDAVVENGFSHLQFNMACAGLPSMPTEISLEVTNQVSHEISVRKLSMDALSGTFNMIHPDKLIVEKGLKSLEVLISNAKQIGTSIITLCSGSCDTGDMWRFHPGNNSREAWLALGNTLEHALTMAESKDVILGIEPELANVVNSADKARKLLDEMQCRHLRIVFDPANLFEKAEAKEIEKIIAYGIELLGKDIVIAHAKDRKADGSFTTAGLGVLPYSFFIHQLRETGFEGALITHALKETEAKQCGIFLKKQLSYVDQ